MKNRRTLILSILAISILCLSVVGLTFAYFSSTISHNQKTEVNVETSSNAYIYFDTGSGLELIANQPGYSDELIFSVKLVGENRATVSSLYDINWYISENTFEYDPNSDEKTPELLYEVYMSEDKSTWNKIANGDATTLVGTNTLIDNQKIEVEANKEVTQYWKVVFHYVSLNKDQSYNMNKKFISSIKVENVE